jgi:hypothetical protein
VTVVTVTVEAKANIFGMRVGERATFPADYPELAECLAAGLVVDVTGEPPLPPGTTRHPCGCGH